MIFCIITMFFSGGLIPTFILIRGLGLFNTFWVMVIPGLLSVWNMIIFRTFFQALPAGLEESAKIDGCGYWSTFFRNRLPYQVRLSRPCDYLQQSTIGTIGLLQVSIFRSKIYCQFRQCYSRF